MGPFVRFAAFALSLLLTETAAFAEDFALQDGDTVVFLGDSITAARSYGKLIENYTLLRFPDRKVRFINVGQGGDTAAGGLARLQGDVFDNGATVLTVAFGINDIGWGLRADAEHRKTHTDAIAEIVRRCRDRGVRCYICSAAATASDPDKSENEFFKLMCDDDMQIARDNGGFAIDVQGTMRQIQKRMKEVNAKIDDKSKQHTLHAPDGVHLNDLGQVAMAYAILKGLGAPADVSSASIDADGAKVLAAKGCEVSDARGSPDRLEFTRLDAGLPLNGETFFALHFRWVPIPDELNRYLLTAKSLRPGKYTVSADGRQVGTWSAEELGQGVNLASSTPDPWLPGGPWSAQANILHSLTEARDKLDMARLLATAHLEGREVPEQLSPEVRAANARLEEMQRIVARPRPYRFVIEPAPAGDSAAAK